jgi:hypothetical protein
LLERRAETLENGVAMTTEDAPRRGRPGRADASAKAMQDVDMSKFDALDVLRRIAADESAPASARVAAVRELLAAETAAKARAWNAKMGL